MILRFEQLERLFYRGAEDGKALRHRGRTDVLSFLLDQGDGLEGEVVVAAQTALRTAPHYGWPPHDELLLYVVHGTLHLVGRDDASPAQRAEMRKRETAILEGLGITRKRMDSER